MTQYTTDQIVAALDDAIGVYQNLAHRHPDALVEFSRNLSALRSLAESYPKLVEDAERWRLHVSLVKVGRRGLTTCDMDEDES